ncbi:NADP-dependent oxidoreductase [Pseudoalteromonas luteoviolacea]|uniref:NADP-dependent oxidoreductase n=1 Tax=Pseudoalteromonas luteoviolacea TaxID=43657 RepID=UPI001B3726EF|nr:NADP-dependent oxidoreductase [Pseudoalteromonas luteoviolacea]MBQ4812311.1 NADP-dependent oxidoreductase [Pseudoalteromonas luteoviolacea]
MNNQYKQIGITEFGTSEQLCVREAVTPMLDTKQVWVRVLASSVNPIDIKTRSGLGYVAQAKSEGAFLPLGYDLLGVVEQVGDKVAGIQPGDTVLGMVGFPTNPGCYASHVVADIEQIISIDEKVSLEIAGLSLAGLTAVQALSKLSPSNGTLYINAPTGGVGHLAVQTAMNAGFDVVAVTTRSDLIESMEFKVPNVHYEDFFAHRRTGQLLDLVGGDIAKQMLSNMASGTHFVTVPTVTKDDVITHGQTLNMHGEGVLVMPNREQLNALYQAVRADQLKVLVSKKYTLDEVSQAHSFVEQGQHFGKVIIVA